MTPDRNRAWDAAMLHDEFQAAHPEGDMGAYMEWLQKLVIDLRKSRTWAEESASREIQRYCESGLEVED